jgi:hypothetical protein
MSEPINTAKDNMQVAIKKIAQLDEQIAQLPYMQTEAEKPKEAAQERKMMKEFLDKEKERVGKFLKEKEKELKKAEAQFACVPISLWKGDKQDSDKVTLWYCNFPDAKRGAQWATTCIRKDNWDEYRLAKGVKGSGKDPGIPPYACHGDLPVEYLDTEVNMREIMFVRRMHGEGALNMPHKESYVGHYFEGRKEGEGFSHTALGKFEGKFVNNHRRDVGVMRYGNGDKWEGKFDVNIYHQFPDGATTSTGKISSLITKELYHYGVPQEKGKYTFNDGAVYEGEMKDGKITGWGVYVSALGDKYEGNFVDGLLHGEGTFIDAAGMELKGTWKHGVLHGDGEYKDSDHRHYKGTWEEGLIHGYGTYTFENGDQHCGFYNEGYREGRGYMHWGNMEAVYDNKVGKMKYFYDNLYEGNWYRGRITSGSTNYDHYNDYWQFCTNGKSPHYDRLHTLQEEDNKRIDEKSVWILRRIEATTERMTKIHKTNLNRFKARWKDEQTLIKQKYLDRKEEIAAEKRNEEAKAYRAKLEREKKERQDRLKKYMAQAKGEDIFMVEEVKGKDKPL